MSQCLQNITGSDNPDTLRLKNELMLMIFSKVTRNITLQNDAQSEDAHGDDVIDLAGEVNISTYTCYIHYFMICYKSFIYYMYWYNLQNTAGLDIHELKKEMFEDKVCILLNVILLCL